jgi:hypothetical protein
VSGVALIDTRLVVRVTAAVTAAMLLVATVVGVAFGSVAQHWFHFGFAGVPRTPSAAASIFVNNARLAAAPVAAAALTQLRRIAEVDGDGLVTSFLRGVETACGLALLGAVVLNLVLVGASLGAYGERVLRTMLPHGPLELGAYSMTLGLYLRVRREPVPARCWGASALLAIAMLGAGALLETFASG